MSVRPEPKTGGILTNSPFWRENMKSRFLLLMASCLLWAGVALAQININTATPEQLDGLKGIGPTKAKAIVDYRKKNGPFKSVDELQNVPGIGPATLKDLRPDVVVSGTSRAPVTASTPAARPLAETPKPAALPPARPMVKSNQEAARPAAPALPGKTAPAPVAAEKPATPAGPAKPAMPGKPAVDSKPQAVPAVAAEKLTAPAAPARPAMPGKAANEAKAAAPASAMKPASPPAVPAKPASPATKPAAPAAPAKPAAPAGPAASY
uniref:Competence protein ComEA helix-hairpin-helix region n=1 Tax=Dechloromonas aromatica (strain RCB) TaxID=159087 RepID=Q47IV8_DECAR